MQRIFEYQHLENDRGIRPQDGHSSPTSDSNGQDNPLDADQSPIPQTPNQELAGPPSNEEQKQRENASSVECEDTVESESGKHVSC